MKANRFDDCLSNSFSTLLICLQCCHNHFEGGHASNDVLHVLGDKVDWVRVVFSRW